MGKTNLIKFEMRKIKLFDYQRNFLRVIQESFKEQISEAIARVLVVLATGLGKTILAAFWVKEELEANPKQRILFLCHENNILNQSFNRFNEIINEGTVMRKFYGQGNTKDFLADSADIVFGSFQTFVNWRHAFDCDHFDIIIVDESHHGQAETYKEVIEYFIVKKRFGMTATPDRMDLRDIREIFGEEIISCDLIEAITNNWLTPFEYHVLNDYISTKKIKEILSSVLRDGEKVSVKQLNETIFIEKRDEEIVQQIACRNLNFKKKTIIFCENINHVNEFAESLPHCVTFFSDNSDAVNEKNLQMFRDGKVKTILAVNKFNEGIDVPDVDVEVFLRGTDSRTIFFQQLGRSLRLFPGKEKVMILDFVANVDRLFFISSIIERVHQMVGYNLSKRIFKIGGDDFSFVFEDERFENIFEILRVILAKTYISDIPHLLEEYSDKNEIPASQVLAGTTKKIHWKCKVCGHEWQKSGAKIILGYGCPACAGKVVTETNNMAVTHPHLAEEYSDKNELPANKVIAGSGKPFLWKCKDCGHEWITSGNLRVNQKTGCPACAGKVVTETNNMAVTHPHLAEEYSYKNELPANKVMAGGGQKIPYWWKCKVCVHEWQAPGHHRVKGSGCPACHNLAVTETNNMAVTHPHLAEEYSEKNKLPADKVIAGARKKFLWKCKAKGHEWEAFGYSRTGKNKTGCPECGNKKVGKDNNLAVTHPYLAEEYSRKNKISSDKIMAGSGIKVLWECRICCHEWYSPVNLRKRGQGCPNYRKHPK